MKTINKTNFSSVSNNEKLLNTHYVQGAMISTIREKIRGKKTHHTTRQNMI